MSHILKQAWENYKLCLTKIGIREEQAQVPF